jgi:hypothetical protein
VLWAAEATAYESIGSVRVSPKGQLMSKCLNFVAALFFRLVPAASCQIAVAQITGDQQKALDAITLTADRICNVVKMEGSAQNEKVSGQVKAELNGLAKRLADLGVSGSAEMDTSEYHGLLQQDLTLALKDNAACKQHVFDKLSDKLLPSPDRKSDENANPTIQVLVDNAGVFLSNRGGKAFNIDVTSDAKLSVSCHESNRLPIVFSAEISMTRVQTSETSFFWLGNLPKALSDLSSEFRFVQYAIRLMVEFEDSYHNAYRRYFGITCHATLALTHDEFESFLLPTNRRHIAMSYRCEVLELGPKAYNAFYKEQNITGPEEKDTVYPGIFDMSDYLSEFVTRTHNLCRATGPG